MNTYEPPGRLRRYDLIFIDEASQIGDAIFECIWCGGRELPQKPSFVIGADVSQVAPIGGGDRFKQDAEANLIEICMRTVTAFAPVSRLLG